MPAGNVSHISEIVSQETNTAGVMTPILSVDPKDGTMLQVKNAVSTGSSPGVPIVMNLEDANGDPLPDDTDLIIKVHRPGDEEPIVVSQKARNISSWNRLTLAEQENEENIDATKLPLKGALVSVRYVDEMTVEIDSSAAVDWSTSEFYMNEQATRTVEHEVA